MSHAAPSSSSLPGSRAGAPLVTLLMLATAPALFASNMVAARWAHEIGLPPVFLACGRWLTALLLLAPFAWPAWRRHRHALRQAWPALLPLALLGMGVAVAPQYIGAQSTGATNIALIFSCSPLLVVLLETVLWREPLAPARAAGLLLALAGVLAVLTRGDLQVLATLSFGSGDLWVLFAATGWAFYTVLLKRARMPRLPDSLRLAAMMAGGVVALAPFAGIEAAMGATAPLHDPRLYGTLLFLALVPSLGAYVVYGKLVQRAGPATAGLSMFLVPAYAALLAWPLLGEHLQGYHALGFGLILAGVKLAAGRKRPRGQLKAAAAA
ncbi:MAG: DMT family transporter [Bordetella sp.]|nr:DMT family transporter [Bordetella genomosp. 1]MDQ8031521.1 DMT family transporter [Bordetella sp.]